MPAPTGNDDDDDTPAEYTRRDFIYLVCVCCCAVMFFGAITWWTDSSRAADDTPPGFSVTVTETGGSIVDPLNGGPVIHAAFDLTLRIDNAMDTNMCMSHAGQILGWAVVGDLCVDKLASTEVIR